MEKPIVLAFDGLETMEEQGQAPDDFRATRDSSRSFSPSRPVRSGDQICIAGFPWHPLGASRRSPICSCKCATATSWGKLAHSRGRTVDDGVRTSGRGDAPSLAHRLAVPALVMPAPRRCETLPTEVSVRRRFVCGGWAEERSGDRGRSSARRAPCRV